MKQMNKIGFWKSKQEPDLPDPNDLIDPKFWKDYDKDIIVKILKNAQRHIGYMGWSNCRICNRHNGTEDLRIGKYIFPSGLYHYVEEHDVKLPKEFIDYIIENCFERPMVDMISHEAKAVIDRQLMLKWGVDIGEDML